MKKILLILFCILLTGCLSLNDFYSKKKDDIKAYCKQIYPKKTFSDDVFKKCLIDGTGFLIN